LIVVAVLLVTPGSVWAQGSGGLSAEVVEAAERGRELFDEGRFEEAIELLTEAYQAHSEPIFFQYIGRCYQELDDVCQASAYYRRFLDEAAPPDSIRQELEERQGDLARQCTELEVEDEEEAPLPVSAPVVEDTGPPRQFGLRDELTPAARPRTDIASYALFGVGGAALIPGIVLWVLAYVEHTEVRENPWWGYATAGDIIGITGLAVLAIGVIVYSVGRRRARNARAVSITPGPAGGLNLALRWP
jgi:hypothetical protein